MNHAPLINTKRTMLLMAVAASCPFVQASTAGYLTTTTAAGTSQVGPTAVYADSQDSITTRETARRKAMTSEAMQLLQEGRTAYTEKKYSEALEKYQASWKTIPKAPATQKYQEFIIKSIGDASIAVAIEYGRVGRYDDAEQLLLEVLSLDPNNKRARKELSLLRDPIRNNPALTPEHVKNVEEVNRLLTLGYGYLDLGNYDAAYAEFNRVLAIDPYNSAARKGQESISKRRSNYYRAAHDAFRAKALAEVDALWEEALPQEAAMSIAVENPQQEAVSEGILRITENLNGHTIPSVNFEATPIEDAIAFLRQELERAGKGVNFVYLKAKAAAPMPVMAESSDSEDEEEEDDEDEDDEDDEDEEEEKTSSATTVVQQPVEPAFIDNLVLNDVTAMQLLQEICRHTNCDMTIGDNTITISQQGAASLNLKQRRWRIPPSVLETKGDDGGDEDYEEDDFGEKPKSGSTGRIDAKLFLSDMGVKFDVKGATANYSRALGMLTVVNTPAQLDMVEEVIREKLNEAPQMVKVSAKFVEVTQQNDEELSFDWVVNPFSINDAGSAFLGGVNGTNSTPNRTFGDFVSNGGSGYSNNHGNNGSWPIRHSGAYASSADTLTNGLMTGGLRSGTGAIDSSAIQNLIKSGSAARAATSSVAPGILSLSGIYDSGSFQMIMRGLSQRKGVDVMSAPSLIISDKGECETSPEQNGSGMSNSDNGENDANCAKIEIVRRFIYPLEYTEPQIPENTPSNSEDSSMALPIAGPSTPSTWGCEDVGIMMRFKLDPLEKDGFVKFKQFEIRVVDFEGFVNYGSPIVSGIAPANSTDVTLVTLTENRIDMPIFSRRYIHTNPCVYDGHTIAIGGMIEDEVQKVEDKVPVFGDLPLIGRFFRSNAESHVRKNLMIFVTADIIDAMGRPMNSQSGNTSAADAAAGAGMLPGLFPDDGLAKP